MNTVVKHYKVMKRGFLYWIIGLAIFGIFCIWRIYDIFIHFNVLNIILCFILVVLFIFNLTRIKKMKQGYIKAKVEYKKEMLMELRE